MPYTARIYVLRNMSPERRQLKIIVALMKAVIRKIQVKTTKPLCPYLTHCHFQFYRHELPLSSYTSLIPGHNRRYALTGFLRPDKRFKNEVPLLMIDLDEGTAVMSAESHPFYERIFSPLIESKISSQSDNLVFSRICYFPLDK